MFKKKISHKLIALAISTNHSTSGGNEQQHELLSSFEMSKSDEMSTNVKDYEYCDICRTNYHSGTKHVYSKKHKDIVNRMLEKFSTRISECLSVINSPCIVEANKLEMKTTTFWCYLCSCDCNRHIFEDTFIVLYAAMLQHLACSNHVKKTKEFLYKNRMAKDLLQKFIIGKDELEKFLNAVSEKKQLHMKEMKEKIKREAEKIETIDKQRKEIFQQIMIDKTENSHEEEVKILSEGSSSIPTKEGKKETRVRISNQVDPPWKWRDCEASQSIIHPTLEDYQNHLKVERKKDLPISRVGASFDRTACISSDWLPSFRQVWNYGRMSNRKRKRKPEHNAQKKNN